MSRIQTMSDIDSKRCAICQKRSIRTSYFRGRHICDECLSLIKDTL